MISHADNFYNALHDALTPRSGFGVEAYEKMVGELVALRERNGRLFCLGLGGGAANAAHAVNDFRKLCDIEAYAPTDGVAELTARANDEGWRTIFSGWLEVSRLSSNDAVMVFSVGGGTPGVSSCIYDAIDLATRRGATILGVVGKSEGITAQNGDAVVVVGATGLLGPMLTPVTEAAQVAVLHALVSDPRLQSRATKW